MVFASGTATPTGLKTPRTHGGHTEDAPILGADVEQGRADYGTTRTRGEPRIGLWSAQGWAGGLPWYCCEYKGVNDAVRRPANALMPAQLDPVRRGVLS